MMRKGLAITAATVLGTMLQVRAQEKPNILLVVSDDQSYPHAGAYGCPWVRMPSFDFVARNGILFTGCYTPNPKSAPTDGLPGTRLSATVTQMPPPPRGAFWNFIAPFNECISRITQLQDESLSCSASRCIRSTILHVQAMQALRIVSHGTLQVSLFGSP